MTTQARVEHAALFAVLSSLADNKQMLGRRYAYWCNGAPALEAAVAAAAMTQDELGHARTLYPLLNDFVQATADLRQIDPMTRTLHYHLAALDTEFTGWCDFVAANFLVDTALTVFFQAARNSTWEPLRTRARKIVQEEQLHRMHADGWVRRLAETGEAVREALALALERFWEETLCWFGPETDPISQQLWQEKIIDASPDELRERFLQTTMPVLHQAGLAISGTGLNETGQWRLTQPLPWSHWNEQTRRRETNQ
jgi:phenylacetate-CoA oxygenase PaaI subunit